MANLALAFDILARDKASPEFKKIGDAAQDASKRIGKAAGEADGDFGKIGKSAEGAGGKAGAFAGVMSKAMVAAAGAVAAGAAAIGTAFVAAMNIEQANDKLAASLGLTEAESKRIGGVAGSLYADAYGESLGEVNSAVEAVMSSVEGAAKLPDAALEALTATALDFATAFEVDVARAAQVAGQSVKVGLVDDATEAFDLMTAASQKVPVALREDILDAADEYGTFFAQLGFSGEEAFAALVAGAEKGQYGIDKTGDALKEFTIRATDMSTSSVGAFEAIGLDAQTMANKILAGGDTAAGAMDQIVAGLLGIKDPSEQANAAIALFGTPLEDLGTDQIPAFLEALGGGSAALGDFEGAAERMGDTLNDNVATKFEAIKRTAIDAFVTTIGGPVVEAVSVFFEQMENGTGVGGALADAVTRIGENAEYAFTWIRDNALPPLQRLVEQFQSGTGTGGELRDIFDQINTASQAVFTWLRDEGIPALQAIWDFIANTLGPDVQTAFEEKIIPAAQAVGEQIAHMWEVAGPVLSAMWEFIKNELMPLMVSLYEEGVKPTMELIADAVEIMWKAVKLNFDAVTGALTALVTAFTAAKSGIASAWDGLREAVAGPIRSTITWINDNFISPINSLLSKIGLSWEVPRISVVGRSSGAQSGAAGAGSVGAFAAGGTVPGHSPNDRADNIPAWLTAGEYVLPVQATKRLMAQVGAGGMEMLRRGNLPGYALGGLVDSLKEKGERAWDLATAAASALRDPAGVVERIVSSVVPGGDLFARIASSSLPKIIAAVVEKIKAFAASLFAGSGAGVDGGSGGPALARVMSALLPGLKITSTYRDPAHNARVGGRPGSLHTDPNNPAVDIGGPTATLDAFYRKLVSMGGWRELLWRVPGHYDHVHAAAQGGLVKPFVADSGVTLAPGINVLHNKLGKPEPLARTDQPQEIYGTLELVEGPNGRIFALLNAGSDFVSNAPVRARMAGI